MKHRMECHHCKHFERYKVFTSSTVCSIHGIKQWFFGENRCCKYFEEFKKGTDNE